MPRGSSIRRPSKQFRKNPFPKNEGAPGDLPMSDTAKPWANVIIITVTAVVLAAAVIGGLVVFGGQDWLLPGRTRPPAAVAAQDDDEFGLADYVDRKLILDGDGKLTVDGKLYDDDGLRDYLTNLSEGGGVHVKLYVDSDGPSQRRVDVEKICEKVTGMKPEVFYAVEAPTNQAGAGDGASDLYGDLESDLDAP
jgi:hypothetical protein